MPTHTAAQSLDKGKIAPGSTLRQPPPAHHRDPNQPAPLGRPSYSHKHAGTQAMEVAVGGRFARIHFRKPERGQPREWKRGKVQAFSARSRSRLLQSFAKTQMGSYGDTALFITLTYHHEWGEVPCLWKDDLEEWFRRVKRQYPHAWGYWRLEFQFRGAPHYHLLLFNVPESAKADLKRHWLDVAEACCEWCHLYMAKVDLLKEWSQVGRYCSKYVAKKEEYIPEEPGRFWGILGREERAERVISVEVTEQEAFRMRRVFKRLIRAAHGYHKPGGSRSGVWVSCSNETAKRALEFASSAHDPPLRINSLIGSVTPYGRDRPPGDIGRSSTSTRPYGQPNHSARTTRKPNIPLYDERDVARRRAARLMA